MNHQQRLVAALTVPVFAIGAVLVISGVFTRRAALQSIGAGFCLAAGIYAYIHWNR